MNRECGGCTLCCKLLPVQELGKLANTRCRHQATGKGCKVYGTERMPPSCRLWSCQWLAGPFPGQRPDRAHYVVDTLPDYVTARHDVTGEVQHFPVVQVWVDPAYPDAHRDPVLRKWLDDNKAPAIIRYDSRDGFTLFPPSRSDDGQWHEVHGATMAERAHDIRDIAEKIGGLVIEAEVTTVDEAVDAAKRFRKTGEVPR